MSNHDDQSSLFLEQDFEPSLDQDLSDIKDETEESNAVILTDGSFQEDVEPDYHYGAVKRSYEEMMESDLLVPENEPDS